MNRNSQIIVLFFLLLTSNYKGYTQELYHNSNVYHTENGSMVITVVLADTVLKLTTKNLLASLNYENAAFQIEVDKSTFYTGNDSLDNKIAFSRREIIQLKGKLNLQNINTEGHPPLDFGLEGIISTNNNSIFGTGHLEHISNRGEYSCLLTLRFLLKKDDLGLDLEGLNLKDDIQVEIVQIVLNKTDNQ